MDVNRDYVPTITRRIRMVDPDPAYGVLCEFTVKLLDWDTYETQQNDERVAS
jgi:hypothetical protein